MTTSHLDIMLYTFRCEAPQCGNEFQQVLRSLLKANEVVCPKCGTAKDIREAKRHGPVGKAFDTAIELDKKARKK